MVGPGASSGPPCETLSIPMPTPLTLESQIESVVVFARGAVVTRVASLGSLAGLGEAEVEVSLPGLPPAMNAGTLRASLEGDDGAVGRDVVAVDAEWTTAPEAAPKGELLIRLRAFAHDLAALSEGMASLQMQRNALLTALAPDVERAVRRSVRRGGAPVDAGGRVADALAIDDFVRQQTSAIDERMRVLVERHAETKRRYEATRLEATQTPAHALEGAAREAWTVTVRLSSARSPAAPLRLRLEYEIRAARWWPAHTARFTEAGARVAWTREALVAQDSGEDWSGVKLSLSTGDLIRDARLPVLKSLRIGRAQAQPHRAYRPPPEGLEALFAGFDRVAAQIGASPFPAARAPLASGPRLEAIDAIAHMNAFAATPPAAAGRPMNKALVHDRPAPMGGAAPVAQASFGMAGGAASAGPPPAPMPPPAPAAPRAAPQMAIAHEESLERPRAAMAMMRARSEPAPPDEELLSMADEAPTPATDEWLEFQLLVLSASVDRSKRGRLTREGATSPASTDAAARERTIDALSPPSRASDPRELGAVFDYRLDAAMPLSVPSDAKVHRVPLDTLETTASATFRVVPREAAEVYRESSFTNAQRGPLLPGPVEVYVEGALLTTSWLDRAHDSGSGVTLGLGVEERLRVSRNVRVLESSAGLLGGTTQIDHQVIIDVRSALGAPVRVEVVDRIPVTDDKDVTVKLLSSNPERAAYDQAGRGAPIRGGLAWSLPVPAGGLSTIDWSYRVTLPAKSELQGGNRRE